MTTTTIADLGTILGVWAHPDDEAYLMAGTAMLAMRAGASVACVTATAGEAGETSDETRWPRARLTDIRRDEMRASLATLGIEDHEWLHLPDGGLAEMDQDAGTELVAGVVDRVRPDTILTFGVDGMTGHPDHITVGDWAETVARRKGGIRVLAATKTRSWYEEFPALAEVVFPDGGPCVDSEDVALEVELADELLDRKIEALRAQASQVTSLVDLVGEETYRTWNRLEYWVDR